MYSKSFFLIVRRKKRESLTERYKIKRQTREREKKITQGKRETGSGQKSPKLVRMEK